MSKINLLVLLLLLASCGKNHGSSATASLPAIVPDNLLPEDGSNIEGLYQATFQTLNGQVNGVIPGSATIQRNGDKLFAYLRLFGGAANTGHQQFIAKGNRCPGKNDDLNGDGYIDIEEGQRVWGEVIIPLDSDLGSQYSGKDIYPIADETGAYSYEEVASFNRFFGDLKAADRDVTDNVSKLEPEEGLGIEEKMVIVLGVATSVELPLTVASTEKHTANQTLPVACGIFRKLNSPPGTPYTEEIPGPVGPPEEDGGPIDDGYPLPADAPPTEETNVPPATTPAPEEEIPWYRRIGGWWDDIF